MDSTRVSQWPTSMVLATACLLAAMLMAGYSGTAAAECRPVNGHFITQPTDFDGNPDTLDFAGPVTGSIQGRFEARNLVLIGFPNTPVTTEDGETPNVFLFTERLDLIGERGFLRGTTLKTVGEGAFDIVSGLFTEILTILESIGEEGISGQLFFFGDFDPVAEVGEGDYRGEICFTNG